MTTKRKPLLYRLVRYVIQNPRYSVERFGITISQIFKGIDTYKNEQLENLDIPPETEPNMYESSGNSYLVNTLKHMNITSEDAIIDFGCGKGGALIKMADFPFKTVKGVEYSKFLYDVAEKNIKKLKLKKVQVFHGDAAAFKDLDDLTYVYLFNPFGPATLKPVLENIKNSLEKNPRHLTLIYKSPVFHQEVMDTGIFTKINQFKGENADFYIYENHPKS